MEESQGGRSIAKRALGIGTGIALTFVVINILDIFVLPINFFTFRQYEALGIKKGLGMSGLFYPLMDVAMMAAGDHDPRTPTKFVRFITDEFGQRNEPYYTLGRKMDYVLIGMSSVVGSHIDQTNNLASVLSKLCHCTTYTYGNGILSFFNERRFLENPPNYIVYEIRRGDLLNEVGANLPPVVQCGEEEYPQLYLARNSSWVECKPRTRSSFWDSTPNWIKIAVDRFYKQIWFHYLKSNLGLAPLFGSIPEKQIEVDAAIKRGVRRMIEYKQLAEKMGSKLVIFFYPSPDRRLDPFVDQVKRAGISIVGYLPDANRKWTAEDMGRWHHIEDSHWTESAIQETALKIFEQSR